MKALKDGIRRRRSDAERSAAAILDAATRVLAERPDAGLEDIATAAGVSRQTVYAHFKSRELLIAAVMARIVDEVAAAMDAVENEEPDPTEALIGLLAAGWAEVGKYRLLFRSIPKDQPSSEEQHVPMFGNFERVIQRGQDTGEFESALPAAWLRAAVLGLAHTADQEVDSGRLELEDAVAALRESALRMVGARRRDG